MGHCFLRCAKRSRTENSPLSSYSLLPLPPLHQTGCAPQSSLVLPRHQNTSKPPVAALLLRRRLRLRTTPLPVWHQKPMQVGRQVRRCSGGGGGEQCLISFLSSSSSSCFLSHTSRYCVLSVDEREGEEKGWRYAAFWRWIGGQFEKVRNYFAKWKYRHVLHGFAHKRR